MIYEFEMYVSLPPVSFWRLYVESQFHCFAVAYFSIFYHANSSNAILGNLLVRRGGGNNIHFLFFSFKRKKVWKTRNSLDSELVPNLCKNFGEMFMFPTTVVVVVCMSKIQENFSFLFVLARALFFG